MADKGHLATQDLGSTPTEQLEPIPTKAQVNSVANPRRTRLTRLAQDTSPST